MRLFNKGLRKSSSAAGGRQRLGALVYSAMLVGGAVPAGAAENYRGSDPDSYECSSDFNILNRFSAPPDAPARSTKYADIEFTLKNDVIYVKDASNFKDLVYIGVGEGVKYCVFNNIQSYDRAKDFPTTERCSVKYFVFRMRIVTQAGLPVRPFSLPRSPEFDRMDHFIDVESRRQKPR